MIKSKSNTVIETTKKKTSIGENHSMISSKTMNKNRHTQSHFDKSFWQKQAMYEKYRGQGR